MSETYFKLASSDFVQDWSNAGVITSNDDWANVPGIVGYLGDISSGAASPITAAISPSSMAPRRPAPPTTIRSSSVWTSTQPRSQK
jgi:hypothetical protein